MWIHDLMKERILLGVHYMIGNEVAGSCDGWGLIHSLIPIYRCSASSDPFCSGELKKFPRRGRLITKGSIEHSM